MKDDVFVVNKSLTVKRTNHQKISHTRHFHSVSGLSNRTIIRDSEREKERDRELSSIYHDDIVANTSSLLTRGSFVYLFKTAEQRTSHPFFVEVLHNYISRVYRIYKYIYVYICICVPTSARTTESGVVTSFVGFFLRAFVKGGGGWGTEENGNGNSERQTQ